ncbi:Fungal specific transcription factor domain-containing [Lecanosticta acicola]|uniref:Fungal specific transcription factor domain-containing n=1 Tax=Lecanosticta acicola TaxID=111012 RepID=A0AAI8Z781_9PEZI|nr:Fungal specific transcription factor domain-containing [Lecanosticta acicola]
MSHDRREPKRARQACLNCRRKKARCSGEKPICAFCARLNQPCEWDSPSSAELPSKPSSSLRRASSSAQDSGLAARVALLEAKLSLLNDEPTGAVSGITSASTGTPTSHQTTRGRRKRDISLEIDPFNSSAPTSNDFSSLPDREIFRHLIDVYFEHNHNQPYTYFHETSFRRSFEDDVLPEYLMLAFAATACRFSNHEFYEDRRVEAMTTYANSAWHRIYEDSFSYETQLEFSMVQATGMLAAIDFTSGHYKLGWVKFSLTIRFAQGLRLNEEMGDDLPIYEQEERRRTFWSVYLLDALISLGPNRPRSLLDADCSVRLPCHEDLFRNGLISDVEPTLEAVIDDPTAPNHQNLDYFAMTVTMASALGRFIRMAMKRTPKSHVVPWDPRSPYYEVHSILLHFESLSPCAVSTVTETLQYQFTFDGAVDKQRAGHFLYSHAMFHLIHCLLNHPFILHHILQPCMAPVPLSWVQEALTRCHKHATELLALLHDAQQYGRLVQSSFYGYCALAAGVIHRLYESHEDPATAAASRDRSWAALAFLDAKPVRWPSFANMALSLRSFKPDMDTAKALTNAMALAQKATIKDGNVLWTLLDYARIPELNPVASPTMIPATSTPSAGPSREPQDRWGSQTPGWASAANPGQTPFEQADPAYVRDVYTEPQGTVGTAGMWSPFLRNEPAAGYADAQVEEQMERQI